MLSLYRSLIRTATDAFGDLVLDSVLIGGSRSSPNKLRLLLCDGSYLDIWLSLDGDYAFHWEHRRISGRIYRWDNAPHHTHVATFPNHFHEGDDMTVAESNLSADPQVALCQILAYIRAKLEEWSDVG
jgi:hypothetical protein